MQITIQAYKPINTTKLSNISPENMIGWFFYGKIFKYNIFISLEKIVPQPPLLL